MDHATVVPGQLTVAAYTGFEPFVFLREGALVGCDVDVLQAFCDDARLKLVLQPVDSFNEIWLLPLYGEVDLAASGIARFVEREHPEIAWTEPYFEVARSILIRDEQRATLATIDDFEGHTIGFVEGSTADLDTRARAPEGTFFRAIDHQRHGIDLLRRGEIDGLAMGTPSNRFNAHGETGFQVIDVHDFSQPEGLRFALRAECTTLLADLNRFLGSESGQRCFEECFANWVATEGEAGVL